MGDLLDSGSICFISRSWDVKEVTWIKADASNNWNNIGGDYIQEVIATTEFLDPFNWENYTVTSAIKEFIKNPDTNYGLLVAARYDYINDTTISTPDRIYISSEYDVDSLRPKLTIKYNPSIGIINFSSATIFNNRILMNIASEGVKFYIPFNKVYTVSILDIKGKQLISFSDNHAGWHQISSSKLSTGMHIIRIRTEGETAFRKFLFIKK